MITAHADAVVLGVDFAPVSGRAERWLGPGDDPAVGERVLVVVADRAVLTPGGYPPSAALTASPSYRLRRAMFVTRTTAW